MDELKLLVELVADLPQMALWVLAGFFVYKITVVGSIYGVARLLITKIHCWIISLRDKPVVEAVDLGELLMYPQDYSALLDSLKQFRRDGLLYLHKEDVSKLVGIIKKIIDERNK